MTIVTVTITKSGDLVYEPNNKVRRGQQVCFRLDPNNGPLWAKVHLPTCLVDEHDTPVVTLGHTPTTSPTYEDPVSESAEFITYSFSVEVPPLPEKPHLGGEVETKNGNLDVTTDPPEG